MLNSSKSQCKNVLILGRNPTRFVTLEWRALMTALKNVSRSSSLPRDQQCNCSRERQPELENRRRVEAQTAGGRSKTLPNIVLFASLQSNPSCVCSCSFPRKNSTSQIFNNKYIIFDFNSRSINACVEIVPHFFESTRKRVT